MLNMYYIMYKLPELSNFAFVFVHCVLTFDVL